MSLAGLFDFGVFGKNAPPLSIAADAMTGGKPKGAAQILAPSAPPAAGGGISPTLAAPVALAPPAAGGGISPTWLALGGAGLVLVLALRR